MNWTKLIINLTILAIIVSFFGVILTDTIGYLDIAVFDDSIAFINENIKPILDTLDNLFLTRPLYRSLMIMLMIITLIMKGGKLIFAKTKQ